MEEAGDGLREGSGGGEGAGAERGVGGCGEVGECERGGLGAAAGESRGGDVCACLSLRALDNDEREDRGLGWDGEMGFDEYS